jgi:hypothetical protein
MLHAWFNEYYRRDVLSGDQRTQVPRGRLGATRTRGRNVVACHAAAGGSLSASSFCRVALSTYCGIFTTAGVREALYGPRRLHGRLA